jgi:predicted nucleic acid-binding protein
MNAVDTNILIYVNDPRDLTKQAIAVSLVSSLTDGVLIWQVACEYLCNAEYFVGDRYKF